MQVTNIYRCPCCGAPVEFDGAAGKMSCDYCGSEFDVSQINEQYKKYEDVVEDVDPIAKEYCEFDGYRCNSCGGEVATDATTAATFCLLPQALCLTWQWLVAYISPSGIVNCSHF